MTKTIERFFRRRFAACAVILFLGVLVYSNSFSAPFELDDFGSISNNYAIQDLLNIKDIWKFYSNRFILYFTLSLNYAIHTTIVQGYHITNLAIHLANAVLFYYILLELLGLKLFRKSIPGRYKYTIAVLSALIFVSHPIQVNAVTYIIQRTASLASAFYLLAIYMFIRYRKSGKSVYYGLMLLSIILAMFTKENTITIPFMLLLIEMMFFTGEKNTGWKKRLLIFIPIFLTVPIIPGTNLLLKGYSQSDPSVTFKASTSMDRMQYFYTQMIVIARYIRILFLPYGQCFDYSDGFPMSKTIWENNSYIYLAIYSLLGLLSIYSFKKNRLLSLGILWFFIGLSVESSFISIKDVYFEHRLYFPLGGFIIFLAGVIFTGSPVNKRLYLFKKPMLLFTIVFCLFITVGSGLTLYRNYIYSDAIRLWYDTVKKAPKNDRAHSVLAASYMDKYEIDPQKYKDYYELSEKEYKIALELNSSNSTAMCNFSKLYLLKGELDKSIEQANAANRVSRSEYAYFNLGSAYEKQGKLDEAIEAYLEGYKMDEKKAFIMKALGLAYYNKGDYQNAKIYVEKYVNSFNYNDKKEMSQKLEEINSKLETAS